jgi:protein-tyrosine-phosphatase
MKILFLCKHNRFRSKVAEAIFNKLNKDKKIKVDSAGLLIDQARPFVAENVVKVMKEKDYNVFGIPRQVTINNINDFDILIIVADNVSPEFFSEFKGRIIHWNIPDCDEKDFPRIKEIVREIEKKVQGLVSELGK